MFINYFTCAHAHHGRQTQLKTIIIQLVYYAPLGGLFHLKELSPFLFGFLSLFLGEIHLDWNIKTVLFSCQLSTYPYTTSLSVFVLVLVLF